MDDLGRDIFFLFGCVAVVVTIVLIIIDMFPSEAAKQQNKSALLHVKEFTTETGFSCPSRPEAMNYKDCRFIATMILDETAELLGTVIPTSDLKQVLHEIVDKMDVSRITSCETYEKDPTYHKIADQMDALVDMHYYLYNAACKQGMNTDKVFHVVHAANMAKRDVTSGKFILRESDGKVVKPDGWKEPDIVAETRRQIRHGSW
jgi:predicted HAD superfamily Cof-like phosphohydrolase